MKDILLVGMVREKSTRIESKMIRPFDDTCLYKIYLDKFEKISEMDNPFNNITMAVCKQDKTLWDMSKNAKIKITERSPYSVSEDVKNIVDVHHYLKDFDEEYVMWVNGCFPFLTTKNIIDFANYFIRGEELKSMTCATVRQNYFWDSETFKPINNIDKNNIHTYACKPVLESVQCMHICNRKEMLKNGYLWDFTENNPHLYMLDYGPECLDVDNKFEFEITEALWKYYK